jgi:hypothetical protein
MELRPDLRACRAFPFRNIPGTHFCNRLSKPHSHPISRISRRAKIIIFLGVIVHCDVEPYSVVHRYYRFGATCWLHLKVEDVLLVFLGDKDSRLM